MAAITVNYKAQDPTNLDQSLGQNLNSAFYSQGNLKVIHFKYTAPGGGIAADSVIELARFAGPCLILPISWITASAFGSGRTIDMGLQEYRGYGSELIEADIDTLIDGLSVASATNLTLLGSSGVTSDTKNGGKEVTGPTSLLMKVLGDTMPEAAVVEGFIVYSAGAAA